MLSSVRGALKGVVAWIVIILLILAFALFGVPELSNFTKGAAIKVGDQSVSTQSVLNEFNRAMVNQRAQSDGNFSREDALASGLPGQIVQSLATRSLIQQEAEKLGLAMPRSLMRELLSADERFQNPRTGKFDRVVLTNIVQNYQMSVSAFERETREAFLREQLLNSLRGGGFTSVAFSDALLLREIEKREVSYLTMTEEMAGIPEEPTPDKLRQFYDDNPEDFTAPEYRTFRLVSLRKSDFKEGLEASEEELRRLYDIQKKRVYDQPEKRTLYLVPFETEADAQSAAAALKQQRPIEEITRDRGVSLSSVTYTDIDKSALLDTIVAEAAFAADLAEGGVSDPVRGIAGWNVIQIASITAPESKTFEEVRTEIENAYLEQDTQQRLFDALDAMEDARDSGGDLTAAAEAANVEVKTFGPVDSVSFAPGGAIIADIPGEVLAEVFRLEEGEESEAIEYADRDGYFFLTIDEVKPPELAAFEIAEADITAKWRADERTRRITRAIQQVRDALTAGATLEEAATPFNAEPVKLTLTRRSSDATFSPSLLLDVFAADKGRVVSGPAPFGDNQTIVVIDDVDFDRIAVGPGQELAFKQYVGLQLDQEYANAYLTALQDDYNVRIDQGQIDALFAGQQ